MSTAPLAAATRTGPGAGDARAPSPQRQLLLDVSVIAQNDAGTGIQRVVRSIWLELNRQARTDTAIRPVHATRERGYLYAVPDFLDRPGQIACDERDQIRVAPGDIFLGLDLAAHLLPRHEQQIAGWKAQGAQVHMLVYDMLPLLQPHWFRLPTRRNFRRWLRFLDRQADQLICISASVAQDMARWNDRFAFWPRRRIPLARIRLGSDIAGSAPSQGLPGDVQAILDWVARRPTVLMVGTIEPRKAYDRVLAAFEALWANPAAPDIGLLIVGRPGWKTEALQERLRMLSGEHDHLLWLDDASDELLERLYGAAGGVLFASQAEGVGLPLLEAASHGKPLLARDLPVYREFDLQRIAYFTDDDAAALAGSIQRWQSGWNDARPARAIRPLPRWSDTASDLIDALGLADAPSPGNR